MVRPVLLSLFDFSGRWSAPWRYTHDVHCFDIQRGQDVMVTDFSAFDSVDCILAAPPCTDFTKSGARWWPSKDASGSTVASIALVNRTIDIIERFRPRVFAIENPVGRIHKLCPRLVEMKRWTWSPNDFAGYTDIGERTLHYGWLDSERAQKNTVLWGDFSIPKKRPEPVCDPGGGHTVTSWIGPGKERMNKRSETPLGFSRAFYAANVQREGVYS